MDLAEAGSDARLETMALPPPSSKITDNTRKLRDLVAPGTLNGLQPPQVRFPERFAVDSVSKRPILLLATNC
jgi:hypothetical protein